MLHVQASGTPYEIGFTHGRAARAQVHATLAFYAAFFETTGARSWPAVRATAAPFAASIASRWPHLHAELAGLAAGAGIAPIDAVALNARTEIAFGLFADGCTSAFAASPGGALLGQNWDWAPAQAPNLIRLSVAPSADRPGVPAIDMVTEAGLLGKIGLNAARVGVCLNALRAPGADPERLPTHLALRTALESRSAAGAVAALEAAGVAAAAYILVADPAGAVGLECSATGFARHEPGGDGLLAHANHCVCAPADGPVHWPDSLARQPRMEALLRGARGPDGAVGVDAFAGVFRDREGWPASICRGEEGKGAGIATLFNIVMELERAVATVRVGRPDEGGEVITLGGWAAD